VRDATAVWVKALSAADIDGCCAVVDGEPLFAAYGLTAHRLRQELVAALARGEGLLVAVREGTVAGFAWYLSRGTFYHSAYLRLLAVAGEVTGRGVGGRLMDEVEARAFGGARDLFLLVNVENAGAQRFYERRGYVRVGALPDFASPGLHEYIYRKRAGWEPT
jgi:ribosomal protein S18 acetylase RimI-like enzyme